MRIPSPIWIAVGTHILLLCAAESGCSWSAGDEDCPHGPPTVCAGACSDAMLGAWADQRCRELIEQMPWNAPQGDDAALLTVRQPQTDRLLIDFVWVQA